MEWTTVYVSSITNAMRGKTLLESHGLTVYLQRSFNTQNNNGCGYSLKVKAAANTVKTILSSSGIRFRMSADGDHP